MGNWFVPRMWEDGECWIIGGGYSLPRQFGIPKKVIQDVMSLKKPVSAYSPYLEEIHGKHMTIEL